jgi:phosphoglycerate dehydrogenase-like enzyme
MTRLAAAVELAPGGATLTLQDLDPATEILISSWGCPPIDDDVIAALPRLRLVAHAAGTVKTLVTDATFAADVTVTSAAAANAVPVAEFAFAAVIMVSKQVFAIRDRHRSQRGGGSTTGGLGELGNRGRRIGLVGASLIGRLMIERLRTIDCAVLVSDPYLSADEAGSLGVEKVELDELCARCDIVSLHAPALPETHHMIGAPQLALMRDGAWLINTARGSLVDTAALEAEAVTGRIGAFIDTSDPEPLPAGSPLYDLENVVLTPHIAGSLGNEIARMGALAVTEVERFVAGLAPLHPVRATDLERIA